MARTHTHKHAHTHTLALRPRTPVPNLRTRDNAEEREEKKRRSVGRKRKTKGAVINRVGRLGETVWPVSACSSWWGNLSLTPARLLCGENRKHESSEC